MANCSFIGAVEARNIARNNTLIWEEICEIQTQILGAIDGNLYSVIVNDGTPMTSTQSILSVAVDAGGANYNLVAATAVINPNGTGGSAATVTPIVTGTAITGFTVDTPGSGYTPVSATATPSAPSDLNDAQDETDYDNTGGDGTFSAGNYYFAGEVITLGENSTITVGSVTNAGQRVLIAAQDETDYVGGGANGTLDSGGSGYTALDTITLSDGTIITVDTVAVGVVTEFTVTSSGTSSRAVAVQRIQISSSGGGSGFAITPGTNNETIVGAVLTFTVGSAGVDPFFLGTSIAQVSTTGIGTGFNLTPTAANVGALAGGTGAALTVIQTAGSVTAIIVNTPGSGYLSGTPVAISHPNGTGATASVSSVGGSGEILAVTVTTAGSGYQQAVATVTVTAPGGLTPALAFAGTVTTAGGVVTGIVITEGGSGYAPLYPTATVSDPTGVGATFTVNVAGGAVTAINVVTGGSGYTAPIMTITAAPTSSGSGATATATIGTNTFGTIPSDYYDVLIGQSTNAVYADQIQYVLDYFTSLGYNIRAQTNSATADTIQWQIIW